MSFGVNEDGSFDRKHVDDIAADLETKLKQEVGADVDLRQGSPLKQIIDMLALELAEQWEAEEGNYYGSFYEDAFGEQLDKILALAGVSRLQRRSATGQVQFSTNNLNASDVSIPKGTEVTTVATDTRPAIPFKTTESATLAAGVASVDVPVKALSPTETDVDEQWLGDETNVAANTINVISNPISGIDEVTNPNPTGDSQYEDINGDAFVSGRDIETDAEFKVRYDQVLESSGSATLDSIRANIANAHESIENVRMEENTSATDNTDAGGLPSKSFRATVHYTGQIEDEIAQAILDSRPAGIESYGSIAGAAETSDGEAYTEYHDQASRVDIYVDVNVVTTDTFPLDGVEQIEDEIVRYIGGTEHSGATYPGIDIGENVIYDQVFAAVLTVRGVQEADVTIGTSDDPAGVDNIAVDATSVPWTDVNKIDVTV